MTTTELLSKSTPSEQAFYKSVLSDYLGHDYQDADSGRFSIVDIGSESLLHFDGVKVGSFIKGGESDGFALGFEPVG